MAHVLFWSGGLGPTISSHSMSATGLKAPAGPRDPMEAAHTARSSCLPPPHVDEHGDQSVHRQDKEGRMVPGRRTVYWYLSPGLRARPRKMTCSGSVGC